MGAVLEESEKGSGSLSFAIAFSAIVATSFCFALRALVIDDWGIAFGLSETQKGELLGVGLWPFSITIVLLSLLVDRIGFKATFWFAAACHVSGLALVLTATGYWSLYVGTLVMALGNGAVEAAANPLIATLYRRDKATWLNRLHAGWPGGLVLSGLMAIALGAGVGWRVKVALMALPLATYAVLLIRGRFPVSERVSAGVSYKAMLAEGGFLSAGVVIALAMLEVGRIAGLNALTVALAIGLLTAGYAAVSRSAGRPLYLILVLIMIPQAITELSTDSWISSLMEPEMTHLGLQAGWVLVYTAMLMFVVRIFAGSVIHRLKPLGVLAMASALAAMGLFLLAGATGPALMAAATLYGVGKSFFWGTSLGVASEQFPEGGAITINFMAGAGMLAAGILGSVMLGTAQDHATTRALADYDAAHGSAFAATYLSAPKTGLFGSYEALDPRKLAAAPAADREVLKGVAAASKKAALRDVAVLPVVTLLAYIGLIVRFRLRGGYRPVTLE